MSIKTGRYGLVSFDATAGSPSTAEAILSINAWTGAFGTDFEDVTCFQDPQKVYVPGFPDAQGTIGGFWNSDETTLFDQSFATVPGFLMLNPNTQDGSGTPQDSPFWSGLAYLTANINCSLQAPKVTGDWRAAGPFTLHPHGV